MAGKPCAPGCTCKKHTKSQPRCEVGCTCGIHNGKIYTGPSYSMLHKRVYEARGKASDYPCVNCEGQADEWSLKKDQDPAIVDSYQPLCIGCHREYDDWGEMISGVKKRYWSSIPRKERNQNPETRAKNSEAQRARWARMDPQVREDMIKRISESNKRTKALKKQQQQENS